MFCTGCGHREEAGVFCSACGAPLQVTCPSCAHVNRIAATRCGACGGALDAESGASRAPEHPDTGPGGEHRQLTALFCDLVDSTELASALEDEELSEVIRAYREICTRIIDRFGGHIAQYLGDGILVYFGYPEAHEDDAFRATRAGLEILETLETLGERLERDFGIRLVARIGIHTGHVVVGTLSSAGDRDTLALGETINIAARLESIATPRAVFMSEATLRLVPGLFICEDLGPKDLKGVSSPVTAFRVLRRSGVESRFEAAVSSGLTPLVGRARELGLLASSWQHAQKGLGKAVHLIGEPGIGKSRLVHAFRETIADTAHTWVECHCSPYTDESGLQPVIDLLQRGLDFASSDSAGERFARLERGLEGAGLPVSETLPLLAPLLSLRIDDGIVSRRMNPERQKWKTLEALGTWLKSVAGQQPLVLLIEDLHWASRLMLELVELVLDEIERSAVLVILTSRPGFVPDWDPCLRPDAARLNRLTPDEVAEMLAHLGGGRGFSGPAIGEMFRKSGGTPLFVEELVRTAVDSGHLIERGGYYELNDTRSVQQIPSTLEALLTMRLDQLGTAKEFAQLCSPLGMRFSHRLLQAVAPGDDAALRRSLSRLLEEDILYQVGEPPDSSYGFRHALIQEVAYRSMLTSRRREIHRETARALEERFPELLENRPEVLAEHLVEAKRIEEAIGLWKRAADLSRDRAAHVQMTRQLERALALAQRLPPGRSRSQKEVSLLISLGVGRQALRGYGHPEVEEAFERARALCGELGDQEHLFSVLSGLAACSLLRGRLREARDLALRLKGIAEASSDDVLLLWAHYSLGLAHLYLGDPAEAQRITQNGIALAASLEERPQRAYYGGDPAIDCRVQGAMALWFLGHPDSALAQSREAIVLAERSEHPLNRASARAMAGVLHQMRGEVESAAEHADLAKGVALREGFPLWRGLAELIQGWAHSQRGSLEGGIAQMCQARETLRSTGSELGTTYVACLLAEAHLRAGRAEGAFELLEGALAESRERGELQLEPEMLRLQGECLAGSGRSVERAERILCTALEAARRSQEKALELRACVSLGRLWRSHGRGKDARDLVQLAVQEFSQGFGTRDLLEARELLEACA